MLQQLLLQLELADGVQDKWHDSISRRRCWHTAKCDPILPGCTLQMLNQGASCGWQQTYCVDCRDLATSQNSQDDNLRTRVLGLTDHRETLET